MGSRTSLLGAVELPDAVRLPCEVLGDAAACPVTWGHGLGPQEPWAMNRRSCAGFSLIASALGLEGQPAEAAEADGPPPFCAVLYDARGHGASSGWEAQAGCTTQFHWRCLGVDMLAVATQYRRAGERGVLLGGFSMGASSALWAAYLCPTSVRGLILLCVTTAWEIREARRGSLLANAERLETSRPDAACVVRGAAYADLPSLEELREAALPMPVFIACARDDPTHPAEVVERLERVLPQAKALVVDTTEELRRAFPGELRAWLLDHFGAASSGASAS